MRTTAIGLLLAGLLLAGCGSSSSKSSSGSAAAASSSGGAATTQVNSFQFKAVVTDLIIMVLWVLAIERVSEMLRARL